MSLSVPIYNDTPYNNILIKGVAVAGAIYVAGIILKHKKHQSPAMQHNQNKRYKILSDTRMNRRINQLNNSVRPSKRPSFHRNSKRIN